ncbi:MAG: putative acyl-CoA transferase/carnitine dehydratase [Firmicutes bacterium]|nr:putative acyl-CoA transferase/carnitine dehydratase [Bacillota bacterium]
MNQSKDLPPGSLQGVTVVDFTWVLAGPHCTKLLADMGATVIKIEPYGVGANERHLAIQKTSNGVTQSSYSINVNRGKKSLCIDLKNPQGKEIITELIRRADVIVENYAPGVMQRLGLDYDSVKEIKNDIIYCSISCFGHWGPYSQKPGYDMIAQVASGWTAQSEVYQIAPNSVGDTMAGVHAALAVVAAMLVKKTQGIGQNIDIAMMDCLFSLHENSVPWYLLGQAVGEPVHPGKIGRLHEGYAPYGIYQGKNGVVGIALLSDNRWEAMVRTMGEKYMWLLDDPRSKDVTARCMNPKVVNDALDEWVMAQDSVEEVERIFDEVGIPCMRARTIEELCDTDPQVKARDMMPFIDQPFIGPMKMYGSPLKMSATPACVRGYSPFLGEHNRQVLSELLGYSDQQINVFYETKALYHEEAVDKLK